MERRTRKTGGTENIARRDNPKQWQQKWEAFQKGYCTQRLIHQLNDWANRKHGEVNHYLTQMMSYHGCSSAYLHRFKFEETAECPSRYRAPDDAEHGSSHCSRYDEGRRELGNRLGTSPT
uniref:Uncharacterized protein n=1 Tax=Bracon brevicornis TaxID=1563983 RepID=A0A6V7HKU1_9HYME